MRKFLIVLFCFSLSIAHSGTIERFKNYSVGDQVTADNLNGNFNNIINEANGNLDNINMDTTNGFRLYEVLGSTPAAGTDGRMVFMTSDNSVRVEDSNNWFTIASTAGMGISGEVITSAGDATRPVWGSSARSILTTQGDVLYRDASDINRLAAGTDGQFLKTQCAAANPTWSSINHSNALWSFSLFTFDGGAATTHGIITYNAANPPNAAGSSPTQYAWIAEGTTYRTVIAAKFIKIAGIDTVRWYAYVQSSLNTTACSAQVDVGGQNSAATTSASHATLTWLTNTIDVSGLTNGTTYDVTIQIKNANANETTALQAAMGFVE